MKNIVQLFATSFLLISLIFFGCEDPCGSYGNNYGEYAVDSISGHLKRITELRSNGFDQLIYQTEALTTTDSIISYDSVMYTLEQNFERISSSKHQYIPFLINSAYACEPPPPKYNNISDLTISSKSAYRSDIDDGLVYRFSNYPSPASFRKLSEFRQHFNDSGTIYIKLFLPPSKSTILHQFSVLIHTEDGKTFNIDFSDIIITQ